MGYAMSGTAARVLTAVVLIPLVVWLVLWGPTWLVAIVVAGIILLALHEFFALGAKMNMPGYPKFTMVCALGIVWARTPSPTSALYPASARNLVQVGFLFAAPEFYLTLFLIGAAVLALATKRSLAAALPSASVSAAGMVFIAWSLSYLVSLHALSPPLLLFVLVVVWVGDTSAFFVGRFMGKRLLAPSISPKKTWEGAVANLLGSLVAGAVFFAYLPAPDPFAAYQLLLLVVAASLVSVAGQVGDLLESTWKRGAGVKDSGTLLPGHGGILDRIDALLLAVPAVWWYFSVVLQLAR